MYNGKYKDEMFAILSILSQINLIIDRLFLDSDSENKKLYCKLSKRFLTWLEIYVAEPEVDDKE